jgi:hypothetical protein
MLKTLVITSPPWVITLPDFGAIIIPITQLINNPVNSEIKTAIP